MHRNYRLLLSSQTHFLYPLLHESSQKPRILPHRMTRSQMSHPQPPHRMKCLSKMCLPVPDKIHLASASRDWYNRPDNRFYSPAQRLQYCRPEQNHNHRFPASVYILPPKYSVLPPLCCFHQPADKHLPLTDNSDNTNRYKCRPKDPPQHSDQTDSRTIPD